MVLTPYPLETTDFLLKFLDVNLIHVVKGEELQLSRSCTIYLFIFIYYLGRVNKSSSPDGVRDSDSICGVPLVAEAVNYYYFV